MSDAEKTPPGAYFGLTVLSLINLVNYVDRFIVFGIVLQIEKEFTVTHADGGWLTTAFILVFMVGSPIGGWLGDRVPRRYLVAVSVLIWSVTTVLSGFATTFAMLLASRALTGVGEAGYGGVAPAIISDLFPRSMRSRMLAYFYAAVPVGAAIAFIVGSWLGEHVSWRAAFFVAGAPGALLALLALKMPEPPRGATEAVPGATLLSFGDAVAALKKNSLFWFTTAGYTLMTFSLGGLGAWMPSFLSLERGLSQTFAGTVVGVVTAGAGFVGTLIGGWMGDKAEARRRNGGLWISGLGLVLAAPLLLGTAAVGGPSLAGLAMFAVFAMMFVAQVLIWLNTGPINAALMNSVVPGLRARVIGLNTFFIHALGDAISPWAMGKVADHSSFQLSVSLTALPVLLGGGLLIIASLRGRTGLASDAPSAA